MEADEPEHSDDDGVSAVGHTALEGLRDRTVFAVSPQAYAAFLARLNEPPKPNERLQRTMRAVPPWA